MIRNHFVRFAQISIGLLILILSSCNTALYFDQYAYKESISVKVEAIELMDKATENYSKHQDEIQEIRLAMLKIYEYEKYRPNNQESTKMWKIMLDPEKNLYQGFIKRWREKEILSEVFIQESKFQIEEAFELIIGFEKKKVK